jgi:hypothetical protein
MKIFHPRTGPVNSEELKLANLGAGEHCRIQMVSFNSHTHPFFKSEIKNLLTVHTSSTTKSPYFMYFSNHQVNVPSREIISLLLTGSTLHRDLILLSKFTIKFSSPPHTHQGVIPVCILQAWKLTGSKHKQMAHPPLG